MPCYDPRDRSVSRARLDEITQLLCYCCGELIDAHEMVGKDPRLLHWAIARNEKDEVRVKERMRAEKPNFESAHAMAMCFTERAFEVHPLSSFHRKMFLIIAKAVFDEE